MGDVVLYLDHIAHRQDVRVGGAHIGVHLDRALEAQLQPGLPGQAVVRPDADGQEHHVEGLGRAVPQPADQAILPPLHCLERGAQLQVHALLPHVPVEDAGHLIVQGGQDLICHLGQGHPDAAVDQVLRHLHADEAAAHHQGPLGPLEGHIVVDPVAVLHVPQGEHLGQVRPGEGRAYGGCAGGYQQLVIGLVVLLAGGLAPHRDHLPRPVDLEHLGLHPHIHTEPCLHGGGGLEQQALPVGDGPADVRGQSAVGEGDVPAPLEEDDLRPLVQTAEPRRSAGAARHAADDDDLHVLFSFPWSDPQMGPPPTSNTSVSTPWRRAYTRV